MKFILLLALIALLVNSSSASAFRVSSNEEDSDISPKEDLSGSIVCYSLNSEAGDWGIDDDFTVVGEIPFLGYYDESGTFQPEGFEGQDISEVKYFTDLCNSKFKACRGECLAGADSL